MGTVYKVVDNVAIKNVAWSYEHFWRLTGIDKGSDLHSEMLKKMDV